MYESKKWFVVYTQPRLEKKTADRLISNRIEAFCPLNKIDSQWGDRKKTFCEPLFTSYVLVHITEKELKQVKEVNHVINIVYWMDKPAVIRDEEIEAIKNFLLQYKNVKLEKVNVSVKNSMKITNETFIYKGDNVIELQPKTVKIYLPSLGYNMIAEFEKSSVELIAGVTAEHRLVS
jgi:transcription antitermination factor NusG